VVIEISPRGVEVTQVPGGAKILASKIITKKKEEFRRTTRGYPNSREKILFSEKGKGQGIELEGRNETFPSRQNKGVCKTRCQLILWERKRVLTPAAPGDSCL